MWVFLSDSFVSIVADRGDSRRLLVRARRPDDIHKLVPGAQVFEDQLADYRWRAFVDRDTVAQALFDKAQAIDYDNFKNSMDDHQLHSAASRVWGTMYGLQSRIVPSTFEDGQEVFNW